MITAVPVRDKLRVLILPQEQRSQVLVTLERDTPLRRCRIEALGPDANTQKAPPLAVGQVVLVNILAGQQFDEQVIIPSTAVVAVLGD